MEREDRAYGVLSPYESIVPFRIQEENKNSPPVPSTTLLLVGSAGSGKTTLSRELSKNQGFHIRETRILPLEKDANRGRIDMLIFLVDLQSIPSFQTLQSNLRAVHSHYFIAGKCIIVATRAEKPSKYAFPTSELESLAHTLDMDLYFCNLADESERAIIAKKIMKSAELVNYSCQGIEPLFIKTLESTSLAP